MNLFKGRGKKKKGIFIYLACGRWCKQTVITSVSAGSCYITVIICDVMVCVCVWAWVCKCVWRVHYCECLDRGHENLPKNRKKWRAIPSYFRPLQHETPSHIPPPPPPPPPSLCTAEVLVAMVISSLNSVHFHSTPFWWNPAHSRQLVYRRTVGRTVGTRSIRLKLLLIFTIWTFDSPPKRPLPVFLPLNQPFKLEWHQTPPFTLQLIHSSRVRGSLRQSDPSCLCSSRWKEDI